MCTINDSSPFANFDILWYSENKESFIAKIPTLKIIYRHTNFKYLRRYCLKRPSIDSQSTSYFPCRVFYPTWSSNRTTSTIWCCIVGMTFAACNRYCNCPLLTRAHHHRRHEFDLIDDLVHLLLYALYRFHIVWH